MKISIDTKFNYQQKAKIISSGRKIPATTYLDFEISAEKLSIFSERLSWVGWSDLSISNDTITLRSMYIEKAAPPSEVRYGIDSRQGEINSSYTTKMGNEYNLNVQISERITSGELVPGQNIDFLFDEIEKQISETKIALQKVADEVADFPNHQSQRDADQKKYDDEQTAIMNAQIEKNRIEREAKEAEEKKNYEKQKEETAKMLIWAKSHGSERLQKGLEAGYRCKKLYDTEYGRFILGEGWEYDRENNVTEKDHACPSLEALNLEKELNAKTEVKCDIKYLPNGTSEMYNHDDEYPQEEEKGCEAISANIKGTKGTWYKISANIKGTKGTWYKIF